jgi:hypothetical protein
MAPALHLVHETGDAETKTKRNDEQPEANKQRLRCGAAFEAGNGRKRKKAPSRWKWRRKQLKRRDSPMEMATPSAQSGCVSRPVC